MGSRYSDINECALEANKLEDELSDTWEEYLNGEDSESDEYKVDVDVEPSEFRVTVSISYFESSEAPAMRRMLSKYAQRLGIKPPVVDKEETVDDGIVNVVYTVEDGTFGKSPDPIDENFSA